MLSRLLLMVVLLVAAKPEVVWAQDEGACAPRTILRAGQSISGLVESLFGPDSDRRGCDPSLRQYDANIQAGVTYRLDMRVTSSFRSCPGGSCLLELDIFHTDSEIIYLNEEYLVEREAAQGSDIPEIVIVNAGPTTGSISFQAVADGRIRISVAYLTLFDFNRLGASQVSYQLLLSTPDPELEFILDTPLASVPEGSNRTYSVILRALDESAAPLSSSANVVWTITPAMSGDNPAELADFTTLTGTVTFGAGATDGARETFTVTPVDDNLNEGDEQFLISLESDVPLARDSSAQATITDNDPVIVSLFSSDRLLFLSEGQQTEVLEIELTGGELTDNLILPYNVTSLATGAESSDYRLEGIAPTTVSQNRIVAPVGVTTPSFVVQAANDLLNESRELVSIDFNRFNFRSAGEVQGILGPVSLTIPENDPTTYRVSTTTDGVNEGSDAVFSIDFHNSTPTAPMLVTWRIDGVGTTPTNAADFSAVTGMTQIRPDYNRVHVPVVIDDDEAEETFRFTVTQVFGGRPEGNGMVAGTTIVESRILPLDLNPPQIEQNSVAYAAGQSRLWLTLNEPVKVLPAGSALTPGNPRSLGPETPLRGFTVFSDMTGPSAIGVNRAYYDAPFVVLELARPIVDGEESVNVSYRYDDFSGGAGIYDTAVERGVSGPGGRNQMTVQSRVLLPYSTTRDSDNDGMPDAAEARITNDAGNPLEPITQQQQPVFNIARTDNPNYIAYSGIREHRVRSHLGVGTSTTQTEAEIITAYYRSATFDYDGTYQCAAGPFPANYDAPLSDGGCAPVDWGNVRPDVSHTIAWLARSEHGIWAVNTANGSNLPEQTIRRIPELNMGAERLFVTDTRASVTISAFFDNTSPTSGFVLELTRTPAGSSVAETITVAGAGTTFSTETRGVATWEIAGLRRAGISALWRPGTDTASFPMSGDYSLGLALQTDVVNTDDADVPPVLGRPTMRTSRGGVGVAAVSGPSLSLHTRLHTLTIPIENTGNIGVSTGTATDNTGAVAIESGQVDGSDYVITFSTLQAPATAAITVTVESLNGAASSATYYYPVVAPGNPLAATIGDADGDGIYDAHDTYGRTGHLPVSVLPGRGESSAGANNWHHIRPVLNQHELRLGDATLLRVAQAARERAAASLSYSDYAASQTADGGQSVVYEFQISPVLYASITTDAVTGGMAGVIIPLPQSLYGSNNVDVSKYDPASGASRPFSTADGSGYGFAEQEQGGACPDDMRSGGPYRDGENLRSTKRNGDACMVLYIVDGGHNDEDGAVNGIIKDGIRIGRTVTDSGGGGGGAFGLSNLIILLLVLCALAIKQALRHRRTQRVG